MWTIVLGCVLGLGCQRSAPAASIPQLRCEIDVQPLAEATLARLERSSVIATVARPVASLADAVAAFQRVRPGQRCRVAYGRGWYVFGTLLWHGATGIQVGSSTFKGYQDW